MTSIDNFNLLFRPHQQVPHSARNVHTLPYLKNRLKYMHQTFFCPPHYTLLEAINNHQLKGCPFMTEDNIRKYLPMSPATSKGRMKRPRTGIRSTRAKAPKSHCAPLGHKAPSINETIPTNIPCEHGSSDGQVSNIFCLEAPADIRTGTFYTDATGALPAISLDGNQYYSIACEYDTNYIFAPSRKFFRNSRTKAISQRLM